MKNTLFKCALSSLLSFLLLSSANAQIFNWYGGANDGKWESSGNWERNACPSGKYPSVYIRGEAEVTIETDCSNTGLTLNVSGNSKLNVQKDFKIYDFVLNDGFLYVSKGVGLSTVASSTMSESSRIFMQGGSLIVKESLILKSYKWVGLDVALIDLGGGTIGGMTTFNFDNTRLSGTQQQLEGNPLERVSQCLISNGDPNSLAALLTELSLTTDNTPNILKLDDRTTLKKYAGTDWANEEAKDSYYLHIKDGSLYVDYWRNSRFGPESSGEIVPEPSTASLSLLALSVLLIRRRRA